MTLELTLILSLIAHLVGDYIIQTDWMANMKTSQWLPAVLHGITYAIPFAIFVHSLPALLIIAGTHIIIDRYRLAKYLVWAKNQLASKEWRYKWSEGSKTGYPDERPAFMSVWLMIIADNTVHIIVNTLAIVFLGSVLVLW